MNGQRQNSLTNRQAVKTTHQIGRALEYAHRHGILHSNVKPENIFFSGGSLKVSDFGIAKCMAFSKSGAAYIAGPACSTALQSR